MREGCSIYRLSACEIVRHFNGRTRVFSSFAYCRVKSCLYEYEKNYLINQSQNDDTLSVKNIVLI